MRISSKLRILNILMMLGIISPGCQPKQQDIEQLANMNICRPPETNAEKLQAGTPVPPELVPTGVTSVTPEILGTMNETNFSPVLENMVNYIILPQNFSDLTVLNQHIEILNEIFHPLNINIAFADRNLPVTVERIEEYAYLPDYSQLEVAKAQLQNIFPDSAVETLVLINSPDYMGSGGETPVTSAYSEYSLFLIIHEIAHNWGLFDVYNTNLAPFKDVHAELVFGENYVGSTNAINFGVYDESSLIPSQYNCNGELVLTYPGFDPSVNIMGEWIPTNEEILEILNNGGEIFNNVQERIMDIYIRARLNERVEGLNILDLYNEFFASYRGILSNNFPRKWGEDNHDDRFNIDKPKLHTYRS